MTQFKKIAKSETIYTASGLASNKHWVFSIAWLESLKAKRALGNGPLLRRILAAQLARGIAILKGDSERPYDLETFVGNLKRGLVMYRQAPAPVSHEGYKRGKIDDIGPAYISLGEAGPFIDIEYAAALQFDPENTCAYISAPESPILIRLKSTGDIVAVLAGLNPEKIIASKGKK